MTNEERLDKEYILGKLLEILDDPMLKAKDRIAAIKLAGEYRKMFGERKVSFDLRAIIAQLSSEALKGLTNGSQINTYTLESGDYRSLPEPGSDGI